MKRFLLPLFLPLILAPALSAQGGMGLPTSFNQERTWDKPDSMGHHQVFFGAEFPLFWTLGYRYRPEPRVSFQAQAGLIVWPHSDMAAQFLGKTAVDVRAASEALNGGLVGQIGTNYHFPIRKREFYVGWRLHVVHNRDARITVDPEFVDAYYNLSVPLPPIFDPAFQAALGLENADTDILATGTLLNTGLVLGTEFSLSPRLSLRTELGFTRFLWAEQSFRAADPRLEPYYESYYGDVDEALKERYDKYLNLPSLNLLLGYNF